MTRVTAATLALASAVIAASCDLVPSYERPDVELPASYFRAPATTTTSIADLPWWRVFDDAKLVALIREALSDNLDLRVAAAQIVQAQAQVAAARSPIFPQLAAQASASNSNLNAAFTTSSSFAAAFALSWQLDLWGRYRAATQVAQAQLLATEEGRNGVIVSLVAGVAQQYLALNGLQQRLAIVQNTAATQRDSLRLVELLAAHGVQSATEVRQAQTQLMTTENQIPAIELSIAQGEDALATLLGKPPHAFDIGTALAADATPPAVPAGLPSALLERRPDIRQAERQLVAANASIGVTRAQFFPTISLTGALGRASDVLVGLVERGGVDTHAIGATTGVPIFQGGALVANYEVAKARADAAAIQYRQAVLTALKEVSDALAAYDRNAAQTRGNRDRVAVAADYLKLAGLRFRAGVISYLEVLDAQRQLFAAQLDLNASEVNQRLAAVQLYKALGGGWRVANEAQS